MRFTLLGAGRVGSAVSVLLQKAGWTCVGVASRSEASARSASERLDAPVFEISTPPHADCYLIGATDQGISEVAGRLSGSLPEGAVAVHLSGALGPAALEPLPTEGIGAAALHPVAACPTFEIALERLPGSAWGVTCSGGAEDLALAFVGAVGGMPVPVPADARPLWHAASVMTSNGLSALLALGEMFLGEATDREPADVLGPLARGSLENALSGGGAATLTGPIVRGEVEAVRRHLEAMDGLPGLRESYAAMGRVILEVARRAERIDAATAVAMEELLR